MAFQTQTPSKAVITSVGGAIGGGNANSTKPVINGTADAGTTINIYDGVRLLGSTTVAANGTWTFTPTADLKGGTHAFTVISVDSQDNWGASSEPMSVAVGSSAPAAPIIVGLIDSVGPVQGVVANNGVTDDPRPALTGTGKAGDVIKLYDNGVLIGSGTVGADGKWSVKPAADLSKGSHDLYATETNSGGTSAQSAHTKFTFDATVPSKPIINGMTDDSGQPITGGTTTDLHPTMNGTGTPGDTITMYDGPTPIGSTTVGPDGKWVVQPTKDLQPGTHDLYVVETSPAGVPSVPSDHTGIVIGAVPSAPAITDLVGVDGPMSGHVASGGLTTDGKPTLKGTGHSGDTINVYDGATLLGTTKVGADGTWSFMPGTKLSNGGHNFHVTESNSAGTSVASADYAASVTYLTVTGVYDSKNNLVANGGTTQGAVTIKGWFDPSMAGSDLALYMGPGAGLQNIVGASVVIQGNTFSVTVSNQTETGNLLMPYLTSGVFSIAFKAGGGIDTYSDPRLIYVITDDFNGGVQPVLPSVPVITYLVDAVGPIQGNVSSGGVTDDARPTIQGTGHAGDVIKLFDGATANVVGSTTVGANGKWSFVPAYSLADGTHNLFATGTINGTTSANSVSFTVKIDTTTPPKPVITGLIDAVGPVQGNVPSGGTTDDTHPTVKGTGRAGDAIWLYDNGSLIGSVLVDGSGNWSLKVSPTLANGSHNMGASAHSATGAYGPDSDRWLFTVDTSTPAPAITNIVDAVGPIQGTVPNGGITDDARPTISGTGVAGNTVYVYANGRGVADTTVDGTGHWSVRTNKDIDSGVNNITATQFPSGQPESAASNTWTITVDTHTPAKPVINGMTDDSGLPITGGTTTDLHPKMNGTGTPGDTITMYDGSTPIGSTTVGPDGKWVVKPTQDLSLGNHDIYVIETSPAGVPSTPSDHYPVVTIDTHVPATPAAPTLTDDNGAAILPGVPTPYAAPHINGVGKAGDVITVYIDSVMVGTTVVGPGGAWTFQPPRPLSVSTTHTVTVTEANANGTSGHSAPTSVTMAGASILITGLYDQNGQLIPANGSVAGLITVKGIVSGYAGTDVVKILVGGTIGNNFSYTGDTVYATVSNGTFSYTFSGTSNNINEVALFTGTPGSIFFTAGVSHTAEAAAFAQSPPSYTVNETNWTPSGVPATPAAPTLTDDNGAAILGVPVPYTTPHVNGVGKAGDVITVYVDGTAVGTTVVGPSGTWTFQPSKPLSGSATHLITVTEANANGSSSHSAAASVTMAAASILITGLYDQNGQLIPANGSVAGSITVKGIVSGYAGTDVVKILVAGTIGNNFLYTGDTVYATVSNGTFSYTFSGTSNNINEVALFTGTPGSIFFTAGVSHTAEAAAFAQSPPSYTVNETNWTGSPVRSVRTASSEATLVADEAAVTQDPTVSTPEHHTVVGEHEAFKGTAGGHETVDLNVDPASYFKEATAHIEGAKGGAVDTLHLTGDHQILDLTSLTGKTAAAKISGIEVIDLGGHENTLKLSLVDVLNLGEVDLFQQDGKQQLMVNGKEGDMVDLSNSHIAGLAEGEWQQHGTTQVGGVTYNVYEHSGAHTELLIQQGVQIAVH